MFPGECENIILGMVGVPRSILGVSWGMLGVRRSILRDYEYDGYVRT